MHSPKSFFLLAVFFLNSVFAADAPKAEFSRNSFSFGTVSQGTIVEHEFLLKNSGSAALRITGIRASRELSLDRMPAQISPGSETRMHARLDTTELSGVFKGTIQISLNDPDLPDAIFSFLGRVTPPVELLPRPVFFVSGQRGVGREAAIEIVNHDTEPLKIDSIIHSKERFATKLETVEEGRRYRLKLILNPDGPSGKSTTDIAVRTSSKARPLLHIPANTYLRERVYTFPEAIDFGVVRMADIEADSGLLRRVAQTLMVYQSGGTEFHAKLSTDLPIVDIKSERGAKGDRYQSTVTLNRKNLHTGPIRGVIKVDTNDPQFPFLMIPVNGEIK